MSENFIRTTDEETANMLISQGFQLIEKDNNSWTFLNNGTTKFSNTKNLMYTNALFV